MFFKNFSKKAHSEADLLASYRLYGNLETLANLYEPLMDMVYAIAYKYLRDEENSKDAVMAIFEQLIDDLRKHEVQNFRSWLHSLTRNFCLMQLRKNKDDLLEENQAIFMESDEEIHLFDDFVIDNQLNYLETCLEKLNREQQQTVKLFYLEAKCYKEIAKITNFEEKKVKSYIQNGKRNLKICIENKS